MITRVSWLRSLSIIGIILLAFTANSTPMDDAFALCQEGSWALAREQYNKIATDESESSATRRKARLNSEYTKMKQYPYESDKTVSQTLQMLIDEDSSDRISAFCRWRLAEYLSTHAYYRNFETIFDYWKNAEASMSKLAPDAMKDFNQAVVYNQFFDNRFPSSLEEEIGKFWTNASNQYVKTLKESAQLAMYHLRVAKHSYANRAFDDLYVQMLKKIPVEFPETDEAVKALLLISHYYVQNNNNERLPEALEVLNEIIDKYPNSQEAKSAKETRQQLLAHEVNFSIDKAVQPGDEYQMVVSWRNIDKLTIKMIPFDIVSILDSNCSKTLSEYPINIANIKGNAVWSTTLDGSKNIKTYKTTTETVSLKQDKAGTYAVCAYDGDKLLYASVFNVTNLVAVQSNSDMNPDRNIYRGRVLSSTSGDVYIWTVDAKTGTPREGVTIYVLIRSYQQNEQKVVINQTKTNAQGFAEIGSILRSQMVNTYEVYATNGDVAILGNDSFYRDSRDEQERMNNYVYTDRPVYKPGDKVYGKAILRQMKKGIYDLPVAKDVNVLVTDSKNNEVYKAASLKLNDYGTVGFEFTLPEGAPLGTYHVRVNDDYGVTFVVEEYRKPEYEVKVVLPQKPMQQNTTVTAEIQGQYYYGAPVANADVSYKVVRQRKWNSPWFPHPMFASMQYRWFDFGNDDTSRPRHNNSGDIICSGVGKTDANGKCEVSFFAKPSPREDKERSWYSPYLNNVIDEFTVEATILDLSHRSIDGVGRVSIGEKSMVVKFSSDRELLSPGENFVGILSVENLSGTQIARDGTVAIEKVLWDDVSKKENVTTLTTFAVSTTTSHSADIKWKIPKNESGRFRAVFIAKDDFDKEIVGRCDFDVADQKTSELLIQYKGLEMKSNKPVYEVGETAKILLLSEFRDATIWWHVDCGDCVLENSVKKISRRTNFIELPVTQEMIPGCRIDVVMVSNGEVYTNSIRLSVPPVKQVVDVKLSYDKDSYRPGEKGRLKIVASDYQGKPVQSEFSVAVYDKSIEYIATQTQEDIRKVYYGRNPNINVSVSWSGRNRMWMLNECSPFLVIPERFLLTSRKVASFGASFARGLALDSNEALPVFAAMTGASVAEMEQASVSIRTDFRDLALWQGIVLTDEKGEAFVDITWPDSLTTWKTSCVGVTKDTKVGQESIETHVKKNLIARMSLPPFLREGDVTTVSAIVSNYGEHETSVTVSFDVQKAVLETKEPKQIIQLKAGEEKHIDYLVKAIIGYGEATFTVKALASGESDAMSMNIPLLPYGADKMVGHSDILAVKGNSEATTSITIPAERIIDTTKLTIALQPSIAMTLRDALPLMLDYPYGCVEQTMNRFVPASVVSRVFATLDIPRDKAIDEKLPKVIKQSVNRLKDMQSVDGGWGWWKNDESDSYMTAIVMEGLSIANENDIPIDEIMISKGTEYLKQEVATMMKSKPSSREDVSSLCYVLYVLSLQNDISEYEVAIKRCYEKRNVLSASGIAMLSMLCHKAALTNETEVCFRNLENFAVRTPQNDSMHWGKDSYYSCWDDPVEATSRALIAYLAIHPESENALSAMRWLVMNRRGCNWKNTKATGLAVLALTDWMKTKNEQGYELDITVKVADKEYSKKITPETMWNADNTIVIEGKDVPSGNIPVVIKASGNGALFWSLFANYYTLEKDIAAAGYEVFVERRYERVLTVPEKDGFKKTYVPLNEGETLKTGDEVRCTLSLKALNNYSYVVVEDKKPACLVPVDVRSGMSWGNCCSNVELRNTHTAFFLSRLSQGEQELTYNLRAEMPGVFHAMPAHASAMYINEVQANSRSQVVSVTSGD